MMTKEREVKIPTQAQIDEFVSKTEKQIEDKISNPKTKKELKERLSTTPASVVDGMYKKFGKDGLMDVVIIYNSSTKEYRKIEFKTPLSKANKGIRTMQLQRIESSLLEGEMIANDALLF